MRTPGLEAGTRANGGRGPVLVPLDGSHLAERALPWGAQLAVRQRVALLLARVVPSTPTPSTVAPGPAPRSHIQQLLEEEREAAVTYLQGKASAVRAAVPGLDVRTVVRRGDAASTLLELESVDDVQLVVMSTHGRSGWQRWIRGSIAEAVLRRGRAPVVLVRRADTPAQTTRQERPGTGLRVLVPLDGSAFAAEAIAQACRLVAPGDGAIVLTMVVHPVGCKVEGSPGDGVPAAREAPATAWRRDMAQPYLEEIAFTLCRRGRQATAVVLTGTDPAAAIVDLATLEEIDLVVMATHGRGGLGRWRYGSVADAVSHSAPSPVLLVRPGACTRWNAALEATPVDTVVDRPAVLTAGRP